MSEQERYLLRVRYGKTGRLRHLGHLDLLRTVERSIRRAGLPFAVTQGFSPHMKCAYSAALPVGAASESEFYDLSLTEYIPAEQCLVKLAAAAPRDLAPLQAGYVDVKSPALGSWLDRAQWVLDLEGAFDFAALQAAVAALAQEDEIHFMRGKKPKKVDLTRTLVDWTLEDVAPGKARLVLDTRSSNEGALRPDVFVNALFERPEAEGAKLDVLRVFRGGQWHEAKNGELQAAL